MAKFSKKVYELTASILSERKGDLHAHISTHDCAEADVRLVEINEVILKFADAFSDDNERFDKERFYTAANFWS